MVGIKKDATIDLRPIKNEGCGRCQKKRRLALTEDSLCTEVKSAKDDLPVRCVGTWAYEKIYRLVQYFGIFSQGMKSKWEGKLNYIEIWAPEEFKKASIEGDEAYLEGEFEI